MKKTNFSIGAVSYIGEVKASNQDRLLVKIGEEESDEFGMFVIADGMGGHAYGDVAAEFLSCCLAKWWENKLPNLLINSEDNTDAISGELLSTCRNINSDLFKFSERVNKKMGSTLSLLFLYRNNFMIKHTGDSRIYHFHDNELKQLTQDQSWVSMEVDKGNMTYEEAAVHPLRSMITMCMGAYREVELYQSSGKVNESDIFLLCSDGLYNCLSRNEIISELKKFFDGVYPNLQITAENLADMCRKRGAKDNVSLILAERAGKRKKSAVSTQLFKLTEEIKQHVSFRKG